MPMIAIMTLMIMLSQIPKMYRVRTHLYAPVQLPGGVGDSRRGDSVSSAI